MRRIAALTDDFMRQLKSSGPRHTLSLMGGHIDSLVRSVIEDRRRGISTTREVWGQALGIRDQRNHWYVATDYQTFKRAMRRIDISPRQDVFVDFGSGKGRMVMLAAGYDFRRVIGVEFSAQLHAVAEQNLQAARGRLRCQDVELVLHDATLWEVPDDATVLFFFNPFEGEILTKVFDNIYASFRRQPRKIRVIYVRPERFFEKQVAWERWLIRTVKMPCREGTVAIYETKDFPPNELTRR